MEQVRSYFDRVAEGYHTASRSIVWGIVRRREQRQLMRMLGPIHGQDILELGCGAGYYTRLLLASGARHITAVDISERMLAELPKDGVTPLLGDAATFDSGRRFDRLVSAGMLEFVPDPVASLSNGARQANPGAILAILYPTSGVLGRAYQRFHKRNGMHIRLFSPTDIRATAAASGWTVAEMAGAGPYSGVARLVRGMA